LNQYTYHFTLFPWNFSGIGLLLWRRLWPLCCKIFYTRTSQNSQVGLPITYVVYTVGWEVSYLNTQEHRSEEIIQVCMCYYCIFGVRITDLFK